MIRLSDGAIDVEIIDAVIWVIPPVLFVSSLLGSDLCWQYSVVEDVKLQPNAVYREAGYVSHNIKAYPHNAEIPGR